jgi:hypothetical protein
MPVESASSAAASERIRRRRITTACLTCRNRRVCTRPEPYSSLLNLTKVKCNRSHPICDQCRKSGRSCQYIADDAKLSRVEFVHEHLPVQSSTPSSDTWNSIMEGQVALIHKTDGRNEYPVWAVAEAKEVGGVPLPRDRFFI